jgi:hypothetical protein
MIKGQRIWIRKKYLGILRDGKIHIGDPRIKITDHISQSLVSIFWVKITEILSSGSGIWCLFDLGSGIRVKHPGSATLVCLFTHDLDSKTNKYESCQVSAYRTCYYNGLSKLYLKGKVQLILIRNIVKHKSFPLPDLMGDFFILESETTAVRDGDREGQLVHSLQVTVC